MITQGDIVATRLTTHGTRIGLSSRANGKENPLANANDGSVCGWADRGALGQSGLGIRIECSITLATHRELGFFGIKLLRH